jgi:PhnB protein
MEFGMAVNPIPDGYQRVIPYLSVDGAAAAIDFYAEVFGATERMRMPGPDGKIGHAEIEIGDCVVMLADLGPNNPKGPRHLGGTPVTVMVYVPDVDGTYAAAVKAGAEAHSEPTDQFYGDRSAGFTDPFGHSWHISTHVEDVSPEEMDRRMKDLFGGG